MSYFVSACTCAWPYKRTHVKQVSNGATAYAWHAYFARHGLSAAIVNTDLGLALAKQSAVEAAARQSEKEAFWEARRAQRAARVAIGWKPYLRGRWPAWVGLLTGFPLPGERAAR